MSAVSVPVIGLYHQAWLRSGVVRASDLQHYKSVETSQVRVLAAPLHVTTLAKLFTHSTSLCSPSSINWYRPLAGKVTANRSGVALAMRHRLSGICSMATSSMAWEREMSTPPKLHSEYYGIFTFIFTRRPLCPRLSGIPRLQLTVGYTLLVLARVKPGFHSNAIACVACVA